MSYNYSFHIFSRFVHRSNKSKSALGLMASLNARIEKSISCHSSVFTFHQQNKNRSKNTHENSNNSYYNYNKIITVGLITTCSVAYIASKKKTAFSEQAENVVPGEFIDNLPVYTECDVAKHSTKENGIWVIYKNGVYDVTDFVEQHPGGTKILLAAGSSIEPFWALYAVHHTPEVYGILEEHRIGNIKSVETKKDANPLDPYSEDPKRHPALIPASEKPFNAEPPPSLLVDNIYTPNSIFYVRNHLPVPEVDTSNYRIEITGIGVKSTCLTLDQIKKFPKKTISATIQCAGNRRSEMSKVKHVKGLSWNQAAIGNATWSGAKLIDVLKSCGVDVNREDILHVQFEALDKGPDNVPYGASVPADIALNPKGDVILAYEMNGEPLPRDHGFPIRIIVPGVVGARNVKWVSKIVLSDEESHSHWQRGDYKGFSPSVDWDTVDFKSAPAIQELPVISAICVPSDGDKVEPFDGSILVKGYAWSGGGKRIVRVDVSADQGKTWNVADLEQTSTENYRHWSWTLWTINLPIPEGDSVEIWAKAVDSSYNTQPENVENIWNLRGVLTNSYHKIRVIISKGDEQN